MEKRAEMNELSVQENYELMDGNVEEMEWQMLPLFLSDNTKIKKSRNYLAFFPNATLRCLKILDCIISHIKSDMIKKNAPMKVNIPALEIAAKLGLKNVESIYSALPAFVKEYTDKDLGTLYIYDEDSDMYMNCKVIGTVAYSKGWLYVEIINPQMLFSGSYIKYDTLITTKFSSLTGYRLYNKISGYRFLIFEKKLKSYKINCTEDQVRCEIGAIDLMNPNVKKYIDGYRGNRRVDEFFHRIAEIAKDYDDKAAKYRDEMEKNKKTYSEVEEINKIVPGWITNKEKAYKYPRPYDLKKILNEAVEEINQITELKVEMLVTPSRKYKQAVYTFVISENPNWSEKLLLQKQEYDEIMEETSKMLEEVPTESDEEYKQLSLEDYWKTSSDDQELENEVEFIMKYCKEKIREFNLTEENIKTIIKETKEKEEHIIRGLEYAYNQPSKVENLVSYSIKCIKEGYAYEQVPSKKAKNNNGFNNFDNREVDWAKEEDMLFGAYMNGTGET